MNLERISVIMTAFNEEKYIADAIESILSQTYTNFEFIIVDDGSSDRTSEIVKGYKDERIRFFQLPDNKGVGAAHAYAIDQATGDIIAIADADDIHHPERLFKQLMFLKDNHHIGVVDSFIEFFTDDDTTRSSARYSYLTNYRQKHIDQIITPDDYKRSLYWFCSVVHSASMYYKKYIDRFSYNNLNVGEDYEIFYKMNKDGVLFAKVPEVLVRVRVNSNSTTLAQNKQLIKNFINIKSEEITQLVQNKSSIYIWGTGQGGIESASILKEKGVNIAGFLDNNVQKIGSFIEDLPVHNHRGIDLKASGIIVVSSIGKFEIVEQLEVLGLREFEHFLVLL